MLNFYDEREEFTCVLHKVATLDHLVRSLPILCQIPWWTGRNNKCPPELKCMIIVINHFACDIFGIRIWTIVQLQPFNMNLVSDLLVLEIYRTSIEREEGKKMIN